MPILSEETSLYPEDLLDEPIQLDSSRRWRTLHTKPRQEKAIARNMFAAQIPFYLPLVKRHLVYRGRRMASYAPLFPGYVFLFGSEEERQIVLATHRVANVLSVDDPERLCFDLRQIRQLIRADVPLTIEARLVPGTRVRVLRGPFSELEGIILKRRGKTRLLVALNFLQQGASVEVEDYLLERIGRG